jgi:hypothetical protein
VVAALSDTVGVAHKPALDFAPDGLGPFVCTFDAIHCGAARTALLIVLRGMRPLIRRLLQNCGGRSRV